MGLIVIAVGSVLVGLGLAAYCVWLWRRSGRPAGRALRSFLAPPHFPDSSDSRRAAMLTALIQPLTAALLLVIPVMALLARDQTGWYELVLGAWSLDANLAVYLLARRGRLNLACWLYPCLVFLLLAAGLAAGVGNGVLTAFLIAVIAAGMLLKGRGAWVYATLSSLAGLAILILQAAGLRLTGVSLTFAEWLIDVAVYYVVAVMLRLLILRMDDGIRQAERLQAVEAERGLALDQSLRLERKRGRQLELLADSARQLTGINDPQVLVDEATRRVVESFNFEHATVFLVQDDHLVVRASRGTLSAARPMGLSVPLGEGLVGAVGRSGETAWVPDAANDPRVVPAAAFPVTSLAAIPLRLAKSVVGVLEIASTRPAAIEPSDVRTLESLTDLVAAGLQASQLFIQLRAQQQMTEALRRIGAAVNQSLEMAQIVRTICAETQPAFGADQVEVWLVDGAAPDSLQRAAAIAGDGQLPAAGADLERRAAVLATHLDSGRARLLLSSRPAAEPGGTTAESAFGRSIIIVPLRREQQALGLVTIAEWHRFRPFAAEDAASADFLSSHLAAAVANARLYADDRRRANELALLSDITSDSLEIDDYAVLLDTLADRLGVLIGADGCYLAAWDSSSRTARLAAISTGLKVGGATAETVADAGRLTEAALAAGRAVVTSPASADGAAGQTGWAAAAILSLPLIADGQWLGAAHLSYRRPRQFTGAEIAYAERAGRQLALALAKARALEAEKRRNTELQALHAASLRVTSGFSLQEVLESILHQSLELAGGQDAHIFLYDGQQLTFGAVIWADGVTKEVFATPRPGGLTETVARTGRRIVVPDVNRHPLFHDLRWGGAIVGLPLRSADRICGVMNVAFQQPRQFDENVLRLLDLLADQAAVAVENVRLFTAEREQRELAQALRAASVALSSSLEFEAVVDQLLDQIERVVPFDAAAVLLAEPAGTQFRVARSRGYDLFGPAASAWLAAASSDPVLLANLRRMAETQRPVIVADTWADPVRSLPGAPDQLRSWAGVPIVAHQQVIAFFTLDKAQAGYYRSEHADRLAAFAGQAALALQNARLFEAERRRAEEQRWLVAAARDFSAALSEEAVLRAIVRHMTQVLGAASCTVSQWLPDQDAVITLRDYVPEGKLAGEPRGATHALADYPATRRVLSTRQPLVIDVDDPASDANERRDLEHWGQARLLMVPLYTGDAVFGLVEIQRGPGSQPFREADQQLALSLAAQAAIALENARLHAAVQENVRELDALLKANQALLSTLELDPLLHNILAAAVAAVPSAEKGAILLYEPASQQLRVRATIGYRDARIQTITLAKDQGYLARVMRENHPLLIRDARQEDPLGLAGEIPELGLVASAIVAPLAPKGTPAVSQGVIRLDATRPGAFSAADLRILVAFANTAAVAIDNARLHAEVQRLAVTDSLTALANPRAFEQALATEAYRAARYGHALSLIIMDIDSFKLFNDTYGHLAGNDRLRAIADILHAAVRDPDLPVRYGGEEFALLLPHTHKAGAIVLAERIRAFAQAAAPAPGEAGQPISGYTLSLGVATLPTDALSASQLLLAADNAELQAKRGGKNRVCAAEALVADELPEA